MASSAASAATTDIQDEDVARSAIRACLLQATIAARVRKAARDKALIRQATLMKVLDTAWNNLAPVRLARCNQAVDTYLTEIRQGYSALECSQKADLVMRAVYDEDVESCIEGPRDPFVDDRQFPSMPLLMHLRMRFSNKHEDTGWNSLQIMRLQHYDLIFMAVEIAKCRSSSACNEGLV